MEGLKALLDGLAREAPAYNVVARAEKVVRRRERIVRLAPVAAGIAVVLVLATGWITLRGTGIAPVIRPTVSPGVTWPAQVTVAKDPPALPTDKGIGRAALLYFPPGTDNAASEGWRIVTQDGRQYELPPVEADAELPPRVGLSPDGRWLLQYQRAGFVVRDLTSTGERVVMDRRFPNRYFWSRDGRQLVILDSRLSSPFPPGGNLDTEVMVVDVFSGARSKASSLGALRGAYPVGVDASGDLVLRSTNAGLSFTVWFVDPSTGRERRRLTVDLGSSPMGTEGPPVEQLNPGALRDATFLIDEASLLVQTTRPETIGGSTTPSAGEPDRRLPDDLLVIDLNTGKVAERHALPVAVGPEAFPSPVVGHELKAVLPDGLMFVAGGPQLRPAALERLDRTTGGLTTVTTITGDISYLALRGQS